MAAIDQLLRIMVQRQASDLHLTSSFKPFLRIHGGMTTIEEWSTLTSADIRGLLDEIMTPHSRAQFDAEWDTDFAYEVADMGRFRVNVFRDRYGVGTVMRLIPSVVPTIEQLNLPRAMRDFCYLSKGLVLVTGPTGSGKSTTLAALVDHINQVRDEHIITIEDPLEFIHEPKRCLINQREVHRDTTGFARALRAALREDPDIVLVGEMRDLETIETAIETAETGHLVFATLHTNTAPTTVDRVIDKFPAERQNQIRSMLGDALKGVVAQTLCRRIGGGRIAAFEILIVNVPVANHIREGKTFMIPSVMQTSKALGMQTFGDELTRLVLSGRITPQEAYIKAIDKEEIATALTNAGIPLSVVESAEEISPVADRTAEAKAAVEQARERLRTQPENVPALNDLAWLLATNPSDRVRDGAEAVRLAERANRLAGGADASVLDTLGTAYAENGNFRRAADAARKALEIALAQKLSALIGPLNFRLRLYEKNQPFRDA
jgi:twitching motility protein PilT